MCRRIVAAFLAVFCALLGPAHVLAHPLGNFTVNRYSRLEIAPQAITIHYALDLAEIPTFQAMTFLDPSGDGVVTDAAKSAYAKQQLAQILPNLHLTVGGADLPLLATGWNLQLLPGQGGLQTLWLGATLVASTPSALAGSSAAGLPLAYRDDNEPDRIGWREIVVQGIDGVSVLNSTVSAADVSNELRNYPTNLLAKPLNERAASTLLVMAGTGATSPSGAPGGADADGLARPLRAAASLLVGLLGGSAVSTTAPVAGPDTAPGVVGAVLGQATSLSKIVAAGKLGPLAIALAFVLSALWGAAHAFTPGHGKTIVAAYLVGSRGTARHALYLGLTVTATHTMGIYVLGAITLLAARFVVPETLYPWLALFSGLAVVVIGTLTLVNRTRSFRRGESSHGHSHGHDHVHPHVHDGHARDHVHSHMALPRTHDAPREHLYGPIHVRSDGADHLDAHDDHGHDHGHHDHSHLPPGADGGPVTWRSLLVLGVAGGILPCPSALVLFLGATAFGQIAFGLALVAAFSVGLAAVLVAVGVAFVYARQLLSARGPTIPIRVGHLIRLAPIGSATLIALVGLGMTVEALAQLGVLPGL